MHSGRVDTFHQDMSATSGYLSTSESETRTNAMKTPTQITPSATDFFPRQTEAFCTAFDSVMCSTAAVASENNLDGFSSDSDYAGGSDCEDEQSAEVECRTQRKRKVAARRVACGSQNDHLAATSSRSRISSTRSTEDDDDPDDYVDIQPVRLAKNHSARATSFSSRVLESSNHTHSSHSDKGSEEEQGSPRGGRKPLEEDDYEDMAPQYDAGGQRCFPASDQARRESLESSAVGPFPFRRFSKQGSMQSAFSSGMDSFCSGTDSCTSGEAGLLQRSVAEPSPVMSVTAQKRFSALYDVAALVSVDSASRAGTGYPQARIYDTVEGDEATDAGERDYTNIESKDEMPIGELWLERKQNGHDYADPDYDVARHSCEEEDDEDEEGGEDEEAGPIYEAGVYVPKSSGYQSYAGFHNIEVTSEPENNRFAVTPPIAHKLKRKNSEGALHKLSAFPVSSESKQRSLRNSLILGISSRPQSRADTLSTAGTPVYARPHEVCVDSKDSSQKKQKSGRSTPTLRSRFTSFSIKDRFTLPNRPASSLSTSNIGTVPKRPTSITSESALRHHQSYPAMKSVHYSEAVLCASDEHVSRGSHSSPGLSRRSEYDAITSQWTSLQCSNTPPMTRKSKQSRLPFTLLGKKSDKRKTATR